MATEHYSFGADEIYAFYVVNGQVHCYGCATFEHLIGFEEIRSHLEWHEGLGFDISEDVRAALMEPERRPPIRWSDGPLILGAVCMGYRGYEDWGDLECWDCPLFEDFAAPSISVALQHLQDHRDNGHPVPAWVDEFLVSDVAWSGSSSRNFTAHDPDEDPSSEVQAFTRVEGTPDHDSDAESSETDNQRDLSDNPNDQSPDWYPDPHDPEGSRSGNGQEWTRDHGRRTQPPTRKPRRPPSWKSLAVLALSVGPFPAFIVLALYLGLPPLLGIIGSAGMAIGALSLAKDAEWEIGQSGGRLGGEGLIWFGEMCAGLFLIFMGLGLLIFLAGSLM